MNASRGLTLPPRGAFRAFGLALGVSVFLATLLHADDRSTEILKHTCANELDRLDITLFKNGTVRLREGPWDEPRIYLAEIGPEAVEDNIRVLADAYAVASIDSLEEPALEGAHGRPPGGLNGVGPAGRNRYQKAQRQKGLNEFHLSSLKNL